MVKKQLTLEIYENDVEDICENLTLHCNSFESDCPFHGFLCPFGTDTECERVTSDDWFEKLR